MAQGQGEPIEEGMSESASIASVGTLGPPLLKVSQEGILGKTARVARVSMARGLVLFRDLVVQGIRDRGVLLDPTRSSYLA